MITKISPFPLKCIYFFRLIGITNSHYFPTQWWTVFSVRYVLHIYIRSRLISVCTAVQFPVSTLLLHSDRVEQSAKAVLRLTAFQHSLFHNLSVTGLMSLYFCVHVPKSPSWKQKALSSGYSELSVEWVSLLIMKPHCDECNKVVNWSGPVHESRNRHFQFSE